MPTVHVYEYFNGSVSLSSGHRRAVVSKPRIDMCSREALRFPELKDRIELNKIRDHFICMYSI